MPYDPRTGRTYPYTPQGIAQARAAGVPMPQGIPAGALPPTGAAAPMGAQGAAPASGSMMGPPAPQMGPPNPAATMGPPAPPQAQLDQRQDQALMRTLLGNYGNELELSEAQNQLAQAQALRNTAMPESRQAGRVVVAANPLEFIGAGLKQYAGAKQEKAAREQAAALRKTIGENVGRYGGLVTRD